MPDRTPIALWQHSIRMFLWLFVTYAVVGAAAFLVGSVLSLVAGPDVEPFWLLIPLVFAVVLIPFAVAFHFGRDLRIGDHLNAASAAMAGLGGAGLLVLASLLAEAAQLALGWEEPDFDQYPLRVIASLAFMPVIAGVTALGAWWAGRSKRAEHDRGGTAHA